MAKIKAAVIFGGVSGEHELSLASAADVIRSIPADKYEVICIGITKKAAGCTIRVMSMILRRESGSITLTVRLHLFRLTLYIKELLLLKTEKPQ